MAKEIAFRRTHGNARAAGKRRDAQRIPGKRAHFQRVEGKSVARPFANR